MKRNFLFVGSYSSQFNKSDDESLLPGEFGFLDVKSKFHFLPRSKKCFKAYPFLAKEDQ